MQRSSRNHQARLLNRVENCDRLDGDPVVVRGRQRQPVSFEAGQDAGQDGPGLVGRGRERNLAQGHPQDVLRHARRGPLAGSWDRRELFGIDPLDVGLEATGLDVKCLLGLQLELDSLISRQSGDYVRQQAGGDGHRATRVDLARHPVRDSDLKVGGSQLQTTVFSAKQHIVEDG